MPDERFDAVISCDNSLPHLLSDADLAASIARAPVAPAGLAGFTDVKWLDPDESGYH